MEDDKYEIGDLIKFKFADVFNSYGIVIDIIDEDIYLVSWQKYPNNPSTEHRKALKLISKVSHA